jgi:hypothetical protein
MYSAAGVDYQRSHDLLKAKKWHKADEATWAVMCHALYKAVGKYLFNRDLENLNLIFSSVPKKGNLPSHR